MALKWRGMFDSRPDAKKPKAGKLDRTSPAKSVTDGSGTNVSSFADRGNKGGVNWKGSADSRPDCK